MDKSERFLQSGVKDFLPNVSLTIKKHEKSNTINSTGLIIAFVCTAVACLLLLFDFIKLLKKSKNNTEGEEEGTQMEEIKSPK